MDAAHDATALTLAVAAGFLMFAGGFWAILSLGQWALAPINRPRLGLRMPTQFSLRECLLLMTQVQLAVAGGLWWFGESSSWSMVASCLIAVSLIAVWWHGAGRLSRCGITCPMRRGVFLMVFAPLACAAIVAALWINGRAVLDICLGQPRPLAPWLAGNLAIIGAFLICRLLSVWAMRNVTPRETPAAADVGIQYVSP